MAQQFSSGDTVQLKSGGPVMTIVQYGKFSMGTVEGYKCRWFDDKNKLTEDVFTEAELKSYVQPKPGGVRFGATSKGV
jgi:uncharacterized protein YodC (DUF2158 family)